MGRRKEGAPVVFAAGVGAQVRKVVPSAPYQNWVRGSSCTGEMDIPGRSSCWDPRR